MEPLTTDDIKPKSDFAQVFTEKELALTPEVENTLRKKFLCLSINSSEFLRVDCHFMFHSFYLSPFHRCSNKMKKST